MRLAARLLLPTVAITCALLTGCEKEGAEGSFTSSPSYTAAHPLVPEGRATAVAPPPATTSYPQAPTGPGTASIVPTTTQPEVIAFVGREIEEVNQLIQDGKLDRAAVTLKGINLTRSSWSLATQAALEPKIAAARKNLDTAQQQKA